VRGKKKKLVGMVSSWDVLEKLVMNLYEKGGPDGAPDVCSQNTVGDQDAPAEDEDSGGNDDQSSKAS
ncbi:MAG: hypothetical protein ABFS23_12575, partial [Pseudomonadota bacterium]